MKTVCRQKGLLLGFAMALAFLAPCRSWAAGYNVWVDDMSAVSNYHAAADCTTSGAPYPCCTGNGTGCGGCTAAGSFNGKTIPRCDDTSTDGGFDYVMSVSDGATAALSAIPGPIKFLNQSGQATGTQCFDVELLSIPSTTAAVLSSGKLLATIISGSHSAKISTTVTSDGNGVDCHVTGSQCLSGVLSPPTPVPSENLQTAASCTGTTCNERALLVRFTHYAHGHCTSGVAGTVDVNGFKLSVQ